MAQRNGTHESRIQGLEQWRDGNGAKGAEARLQYVEDNYVRTEQIPEIVRSTIRTIHKEETVDWNKWVNTGLLLITMISVIIGFWGGG